MKSLFLRSVFLVLLVSTLSSHQAEAHSCDVVLGAKKYITQQDIELLMQAIEDPRLQGKMAQTIEDIGPAEVFKTKSPKQPWLGKRLTQAQRMNRMVRNLYWKRFRMISIGDAGLKQESQRLLVEALEIQSQIFLNTATVPFEEPKVTRFRRMLAVTWGSSMMVRRDFNFNLTLFEHYRMGGEAGLLAARQEHLLYRVTPS
ncbi:MAG: hypothetical protein AAF202_06980, partial [Pseudomonadota bacterium]